MNIVEAKAPTLMASVQQGCLAIGDITGYTKYVAGVELEHSQDVLADLMNVLVGQMRGLLALAKLEGDAVFCYDRNAEADGSTLLAMVESCYFAFSRRVQVIDRQTTCQCNACRLIPTLNLKFLIHHGQYALHEVAGNAELLGRDVIVVHRLLKNSFTQHTGLRGYALFTQACLTKFGLDPATLGMVDHTEHYEDVGEISGCVLDLEARWRQEQQRRAVYIGPADGLTIIETELPAPPAVVWHYLTSPFRRAQWQPGTLRVDEFPQGGARGVGTTNHCIHGDMIIEEEILDWKPFDYFSERSKTPMGVAIFTSELRPVEDGTKSHLTVRMLPDDGPQGPERARGMLSDLQHLYRMGMETLTTLLQEAGVSQPPQSPALH